MQPGISHRRTVGLPTFACVLLWALAVVADELPVQVGVSEPDAGTYVATGVFWVNVHPSQVWPVLRDYKGMTRFLPAVAASQVEGEGRTDATVDQEIVAHVLFFQQHMHTRLVVQERGTDELSFVDISHRDFTRYEGSWRVMADAGGSRVEYLLVTKPKFWAPHGVAMGAFHGEATDLLNAVRKEILRRAERYGK